jgi:hypothetical protein
MGLLLFFAVPELPFLVALFHQNLSRLIPMVSLRRLGLWSPFFHMAPRHILNLRLRMA